VSLNAVASRFQSSGVRGWKGGDAAVIHWWPITFALSKIGAQPSGTRGIPMCTEGDVSPFVSSTPRISAGVSWWLPQNSISL
jgi:hypothetical protein